jgi:predicted dehydrogenase
MTEVEGKTGTRIGIIGVGQIGKHHLNNYQTLPNVEVVAIADIDRPEASRDSS